MRFDFNSLKQDIKHKQAILCIWYELYYVYDYF